MISAKHHSHVDEQLRSQRLLSLLKPQSPFADFRPPSWNSSEAKGSYNPSG